MSSIFFALKLISSRLPIGVEIMYRPFSRLIIPLMFIASCAPVNNISVDNFFKKNSSVENKQVILKKDEVKEINIVEKQKIFNSVEIILPTNSNKKITKHLINSFELSIYKKEIDNITFKINRYENLHDLESLLKLTALPGKIFVGTLTSEATQVVKKFCKHKILFFSFSADKNFAGECVYLINFFPEDDLVALFNFLPIDSRIALLYPKNYYGNNINKIIDPIALKSGSIIISRASYKEDLSDAREAIKKLGKYELRKFELERQKKILKKKDDEISKNALKKIQKFETIGNVDFTHLILPDYGIRLLEIAPLLPFYDVDPNKVQFIGTGVWDDELFFDEPSLQGAIFSGIEKNKRDQFVNDYSNIYQDNPMRTATIPFDLIGIISYIIDSNLSVEETYSLLNDSSIKFDGIDGKFFFKNNSIFRELDILQIFDGSAKKLN